MSRQRRVVGTEKRTYLLVELTEIIVSSVLGLNEGRVLLKFLRSGHDDDGGG